MLPETTLPHNRQFVSLRDDPPPFIVRWPVISSMGPVDPRRRYDDLLELSAEEMCSTAEFEEAVDSEPVEMGWVVLGIVFDDDGNVLLIEQPWADGWLFPGGVPKPGETLETALVREVKEETGIEATSLRARGVEDLTIADESTDRTVGWTAAFFEATADTTTIDRDPGIDDETITDIRWFDGLPDEMYNPDVTKRVYRQCRTETTTE